MEEKVQLQLIFFFAVVEGVRLQLIFVFELMKAEVQRLIFFVVAVVLLMLLDWAF
jgi:hypothetical protein